MTTQDKQNDLAAAEQRFQAGIEAYSDSKLDVASQAFTDAEIRFRLLGDFKRAGDSRTMLAEVQRQNNQLEQAANSYQKAMRLYKDANRPLNEAESALSVGHVQRQLAHLDRAQESYQHAWNLFVDLGNSQGQGNVAMALGHIEMQRGKT